MKVNNCIYFLVIVVFCLACSTKQIQPPHTDPIMATEEIEALWNKVDSLEGVGQYRSAMEELKMIELKVKDSQDESDHLKLAFYEAKYRALLEENSSEQTILDFEKQLTQKTNQQHIRIYHSLLGQMYADYAIANQFKIANRTHVVSNSTDITTWSMKELLEKSNWHFTESVKDGTNKNITLDVNNFLDKPLKSDAFDLNTLLMLRAVKHFGREFSLTADHTDSFILLDEEAFSNKESFIQHDFQNINQDPNSSQYLAIQLYQQLLTYHNRDKAISGKLDSERLNYMYRISQSSNKEQLYQEALSNLAQTSDHAKLSLANYWINNQWTDKSINLEEAKTLLEEVKSNSKDSTLLYDASNLIEALELPQLNIQQEEVVLPQQSTLFHIQYKNIEELNLSVVSFPSKQFEKYQKENKSEERLKLINKLVPLNEWMISLPNSSYRHLSTESKLPSLPIGRYALISKHKDQIAVNFFQVSNIAAHSMTSLSGVNVQVFHRDSGQLNDNVKVEQIETHYGRKNRVESVIQSQQTNASGEASFKLNDNRRTRLRFSKSNDIYDSSRILNRFYGNNTDQATIHIFTDRNLYRPGDRLKAKAIPVIFDKSKKQNRLLINETLDIIVRDPNYQEIHKEQLTTNEFGSVSFDFVIDDDRLTGSYTIELRNKSNTIQGSQQFQVEEYKRASFVTTIQFPQEEFVLGDTINVTTISELLAGAPLSDARVYYRVSRRQNNRWYRPYGNGTPDAEIVNGLVQTDANGEASFDLPLTAPIDPYGNYIFDIDVRVVDITGETQFTSEGINVNKLGIFTQLDIESITDNDQLSNTDIKMVNSNGAPLTVDLQIEVHQLDSPTFWKKNKYWSQMDTMSLSAEDYADMPYEYVHNASFNETWKELKTIHEESITSGINTKLDLPTLASGYYVLKIKKNDTVISESRFQVVDFNNSVNPSPDLIAYKINKESFEPGEELIIDLVVPNEEVKIQYLVEKNDNYVEKNWLEQGGQLKEIIQNSDRGGFVIHLISVFQNRMEYKQINVNVPYTNLQLAYKIDRLKSTLLPGEDVSWKIRFVDHDERPVITESVWTMYDSSLDQLYRRHDWQQFHLPQYFSRVNVSNFGFSQSHSSILFYPADNRLRTNRPDDSWPDFNTHGFTFSNRQYGFEGRVLKRAGAPMAESSMSADVANKSTYEEVVEFEDQDVQQVEKSNDQNIRRNFNETVFFYPHLVSENNGETTVEFKMSDALTSWNVLLFAHDKDGKFVYDTLQLKSSQDIYLSANKPRFSRVNDDIWMTTKIINNTDRTIPVETWIEFQDLISGDDITDQIVKGAKKLETSAQPGSSEAITWKLQIPDNLDTKHLVFRTGVSHEAGSDAIEDYLPVIDDKQLVRESDALFVRAGENYSYQLDKFGSGTESSLQVEMMTGLDWQIIQSLPYLTEKSFETSSQYLYQFVANSIGSHLVDTNMNVRKQLELLKRGENSTDSNLETEENLKTININSTPWVRDANDEKKQKEAMLKFLDGNQVSKDISKSLNKLLSFQQSDGGFSWLADRPSNVFISGTVLQEIGRLEQENIPHGFSDGQLSTLISYIDGYLAKKSKSEHTKYANNLMLINARSIFHDTHPMNAGLVEELKNYFKENWTEQIASEQALIGSISKRIGFKELVQEIFISIREQAIQSPSLGAYWKLTRNYFSNQSSVDRHVQVMEFLEQVDKDLPLLEEAKIWLLNNRRTNVWENKASTSSAVFAFLNNESNLGAKSNTIDKVSLSMDGVSILDETQLELGTQTIVELNTEAIKPGATLEIKNANSSPIWASVFKQYRKPIAEINSFSNDNIKIEKSMFIKELTEEGPVLIPFADSELKPGDRLTVRLTIENDRALQFVHVEDKRASGLEPKDVISQYQYSDALFYYQVTKDQSTHFLISSLPQGSHVLEYDLTVNLKGNYSSGFSSVQCQYAPEFGAHSESVNLSLVE